MAVFLVRIETDFAEHYELFYRAIRDGGTLDEIMRIKNDMVYAIRQGIYEIFKVKGMTVVILIGLGGHLLEWFGWCASAAASNTQRTVLFRPAPNRLGARAVFYSG